MMEIDWKCEHQQENVPRGALYTHKVITTNMKYVSNTYKHKNIIIQLYFSRPLLPGEYHPGIQHFYNLLLHIMCIYPIFVHVYINSAAYQFRGIFVHVDSTDCVSTLLFVDYESKYLTYALL